MDKKKVSNWGGNLAIRLNATLSSAVSNINMHDEVVLTYEKNKIIIRKVAK